MKILSAFRIKGSNPFNLVFIILVLANLFLKAQDCAFKAIPQSLANDPGFLEIKERYEEDLNNFINSGEYSRVYSFYQHCGNHLSRLTTSGAIISIPMVFHIIGNAANSYVYDNLVIQQVGILNNCYRHIPATQGDGAGVDSQIEFCLATKDPNGNPTTGIIRVSGNYGPYDPYKEADDISLKALSNWDPHDYLNVWVTDIGSSVNGYSYFPSVFLSDPNNMYRDGVVLNYQVLGANGPRPSRNRGETLVHEIGHWLNLSHTWGDDNYAICGDDDVFDTPFCSGPHWSSESDGCPSLSQCVTENANAGLTDQRQIANFLDYSDDACRNMFTDGQKQRMLATLMTVRSSLFTSDAGCNSNLSNAHCSNGIMDAGELGVDCGGTCPPCGQSGTWYIGCSPNEHYSPYGTCIPRSRYINIYHCLNGATNGPSRDMLADNYNIGTSSFYFTSGRVTIYADCNQDNEVENSGILPNSGRIDLMDGFRFISNGLGDEIRFIMVDLPEEYIEINDHNCPSSTDDPCPSNQHYRLSNVNSIDYSEGVRVGKREGIFTYPNPVVGLLNVEISNFNDFSWQLFDCTNRLVETGVDVSNFSIDFYRYKPGIYFLKIFNNKDFYLERIVHF